MAALCVFSAPPLKSVREEAEEAMQVLSSASCGAVGRVWRLWWRRLSLGAGAHGATLWRAEPRWAGCWRWQIGCWSACRPRRCCASGSEWSLSTGTGRAQWYRGLPRWQSSLWSGAGAGGERSRRQGPTTARRARCSELQRRSLQAVASFSERGAGITRANTLAHADGRLAEIIPAFAVLHHRMPRSRAQLHHAARSVVAVQENKRAGAVERGEEEDH